MASLKRSLPQLYWGTPSSLWKQVADASPGATFFHHPEWSQVLATTYGYGVHPAYLEFSNGRKALLPIWTRPIYKGMLVAAASGYEGGYGGLISTHFLSPEEMNDAYRLIGNRFPDLTVLSNPFSPYPHLPRATDEFEWVEVPASRVLRLACLDSLRQAYNRERQRASRRWQEAQVDTQVIAHPRIETIDWFYPIYEAATLDWAEQWRRPRRFFENLFEHCGPWLHLTTARLKGEVAGVELIAIRPPLAIGLMLTWKREWDDARVSTALTETSLAYAHANGCRWWDFGASGDRDQLNRFKETFGAQIWPLYEVRRQAWIIKALQTLRSPYHHVQTSP